MQLQSQLSHIPFKTQYTHTPYSRIDHPCSVITHFRTNTPKLSAQTTPNQP